MKRYPNIAASIPILFGIGSPAYIARFVPFRAVNTIKSMLRTWLLAHVGEKGLKAFPLGTDGDSLIAVGGSIILSRPNPLFHHVPSMVFGRSPHAVSFRETARFLIQTTAGSDCATNEGICANGFDAAAHASTRPKIFSVSSRGLGIKSNYSKPAEFLIWLYSRFRHELVSFVGQFVFGPFGLKHRAALRVF